MADAVLPKATKLAGEWLKAQAAISSVIAGRASYRLTGTYPAIRLTDLGPIERGPEEHLRRIQVECWADTYDVAEDLAAVIESLIGTARGTWPSGYCAGGTVESGPFANPDPASQKYRHQLDVALWIYPVTSP